MTAAKAQRSPRLPRGPLFRPFDVRSLKGEARSIELTATPEECVAVAQAIGLPAVASLEASFRVTPRAGDGMDLNGRVRAQVTQTCVVTLEPFESEIDGQVGLRFAPAPEPVLGSRDFERPDVTVAAPGGGNDEQEDPPDEIVGGFVDLGAVAVEFTVLNLDPYPRKPGVHFDDTVVGDKGAPAPSAFAALGRLKDRT